jgi:hypothetical protein
VKNGGSVERLALEAGVTCAPLPWMALVRRCMSTYTVYLRISSTPPCASGIRRRPLGVFFLQSHAAAASPRRRAVLLPPLLALRAGQVDSLRAPFAGTVTRGRAMQPGASPWTCLHSVSLADWIKADC